MSQNLGLATRLAGVSDRNERPRASLASIVFVFMLAFLAVALLTSRPAYASDGRSNDEAVSAKSGDQDDDDGDNDDDGDSGSGSGGNNVQGTQDEDTDSGTGSGGNNVQGNKTGGSGSGDSGSGGNNVQGTKTGGSNGGGDSDSGNGGNGGNTDTGGNGNQPNEEPTVSPTIVSQPAQPNGPGDDVLGEFTVVDNIPDLVLPAREVRGARAPLPFTGPAGASTALLTAIALGLNGAGIWVLRRSRK